MISTETIWSPANLNLYRNEWSNLFVAGLHEPSTSFEWTQALTLSHINSSDNLFLIVVKDTGEIRGILPLLSSQTNIYRIPLVTISPVSELYNTHSDFLIAKHHNEFIGPIVDALFSLPCDWDVFRMKRLLDGDALHDSLVSVFRQKGVKFRSRYEAPSFFLKLPKSYKDYLNSRSKKFRNFLRRAEKKLNNVGAVSIVRAGKEMDIRSAFSALVRIEKNSWKHKHGTAISAIDHQLRFYQSICESMLDEGNLHLTFLTVKGQAIAYNLGYLGESTYYYLKTSYDEAFRAQSPGTVLRAWLIRDLIADGIEIFDFPGEPYEWEAQWTQELRWHRSLLLYNNTIRARLLSYLERLNNLKRKKKMEKKVVFQNPFEIQAPRAYSR